MTSDTTINTREILAKLVSFDTTSRLPNVRLIHYVQQLLETYGVQCTIIPNSDNTKANLYCTVGPKDIAGVMLSGHTDVVPIDGQAWTKPAFELTESQNKLYGRGTTDMKGFVASALRTAIKATRMELTTPIHLAFSYDEEIGCVGVHSMLELLKQSPVVPAMCIVGEPTQLQVATQHKGKMSIQAHCTGQEAHSALAPRAVNAIHLATDLINVLRDEQEHLKNSCITADTDPRSVPYTTVHVGNIVADQALNIVPNACKVKFEIRFTSDVNPEALLNRIQSRVNQFVQNARKVSPSAHIEFDVWNAYPGLDTDEHAPVVDFVKSLVGANTTTHVAFGTEAGLFSSKLGLPTVVCGPGSMEQGHKPDEFIEIDQLNRCDAMLDKLLAYCAAKN